MTAQVPERLILDGEPCLLTTLLTLPQGHPRVIKTSDEEFERQKRSEPDGGMLGSSACWRNYIGTWKITGGKLYLVGLIGDYTLLGDEPLFARWITRTLAVPQGAMIRYVHMGFESRYEREMWITVNRGVVSGREEMSAELLDRIERMVREGLPPPPLCGHLHVVSGPGAGAILPVVEGVNTIGRGSKCDIRLQLQPGGRGSNNDRLATLTAVRERMMMLVAPERGGPLIRVNGAVILHVTQVGADDNLVVGDIELRPEWIAPEGT